MIYLPGIIIVVALLTVVVLIVARGGSPLWRWLFAVEVLVLFECLGNCFVPGSWKQFWQIEIPAALIAIALAITSSIARVRKKRSARTNSVMQIVTSPQMLSLFAVLCIVAVMVVFH